MDYLTQNNRNLTLATRLENSETPSIVTSDASVPISEMLVSPPVGSPAASEVASKISERSEKGGEPRRKRKHASTTATAASSATGEGSRKSGRAAAKKVKETELFSPSDQGVQMSYTPASSSSPGDSLSDRKVASSSVDNVYEFTEQEEGHRPGDEVLLKRKRNSRNYGKPKNRWLLETELKNINESRRRTLNDPVTGLEVDTSDSQHGDGQESAAGGGSGAPGAAGHGVGGSGGGPSSAGGPAPCGLKLRICRSAQSGAYECHLIDKREPKVAPNSPQQFRTARGDCFRIGDVVWAKLVGWPWWPAQLQSFCVDSAGLAQVKWFNWDQISYVHCEKLHHFIAAFNSKVDKRRKAGAYKLAIEQAWKLASALKDRRRDDAGLYDSAADDESSSSDEDDRPSCAQSRAKASASKTPLPNGSRRPATSTSASATAATATAVAVAATASALATTHASLAQQPTPAFPPSSPRTEAPPPVAAFPAAPAAVEPRKPAFSTPTTSSAPTLQASQAFNSFDLFDSGSVGVDDAFDAFDEEAAVRSSDIVSLGPLPDIGPNLNLINSSNMYSFIPSFSDDDEMDTRPVLDPASIDSIMT